MADETQRLATRVGDMLAIEKRLRVTFDTQLDEAGFKEFQDTLDVMTRLSATTGQHVANLDSTLASLGGNEAAQVTAALTQVEGAVAGLIDKVRQTKVSQGLRDDYAALASALEHYKDVLTAATGLGDREVATMAQRHLEDYAGILAELGECIPAVVLREDRQRS